MTIDKQAGPDRGTTEDGEVAHCADCGARFDQAAVNDNTVGYGDFYCGAACGEVKSHDRGEVDWRLPDAEDDEWDQRERIGKLSHYGPLGHDCFDCGSDTQGHDGRGARYLCSSCGAGNCEMHAGECDNPDEETGEHDEDCCNGNLKVCGYCGTGPLIDQNIEPQNLEEHSAKHNWGDLGDGTWGPTDMPRRSKKEAAENPFEGYGRPFSDNGQMSDAYYHDNPANNVGPYNGPNSYSINTVAPYQPPHAGEENPGQNVGPYKTPVPAAPEEEPIGTEAPVEEGVPAPVAAKHGADETREERDQRYQRAREDGSAPCIDHDCRDHDWLDPTCDHRRCTRTGEQMKGVTAALRSAYKQWDKAQWFDGTSSSIYDRALQAEQLRRNAKALGAVALEDELDAQIEVLGKVAAEYDDSTLHEFVDQMPGGTVALEYDDLIDGGLVDVTSFLQVGAHQVASEVADYDWESFKQEGARQWVGRKLTDNPGLVKHEVMAREAAIDYAKDKTMVLMDPIRRADIIDAFVTNAEQYRRMAAKRLVDDAQTLDEKQSRIGAIHTAQLKKEIADSYSDDGFLPGQYTELESDYDDDGFLNIGVDDGSILYTEARKVIEASKRDWSEFTTDGAREWFFGKASDSPAMLKHSDITARAARLYANDQASAVPDQAVRSDIVRAFSESVEFLREAHIKRESSRTASIDTTEIDDIYNEEEEMLW